MSGKRLSQAAGLIAIVALAACAGDEAETTTTTEQVVPGTETVEVQVPTQDTLLIEREVELDVDVDTTRIQGDPNVPRDTLLRR